MKIRPEILVSLVRVMRPCLHDHIEPRSADRCASDALHKLVSLWRADGGDDGPLVDWLEGRGPCHKCTGRGWRFTGRIVDDARQTEDCPACHGTGRVPVGPHPTNSHLVECPACGGVRDQLLECKVCNASGFVPVKEAGHAVD